MIEYTAEEESLLEEMIKEALRIEINKAVDVATGPFFNNQMSHDILTPMIVEEQVKSFRQMSGMFPFTGMEKAKSLPIEDIPLLINHEDVQMRTCAAWRLKIGK